MKFSELQFLLNVSLSLLKNNVCIESGTADGIKWFSKAVQRLLVIASLLVIANKVLMGLIRILLK